MLSKFLDVEAIKDNVWVVYDFVNGKLDELLLSKIKSGEYSTKQVLAGTVVVLFVGSTFFKWLKMKNHFKKLGIPGPTPLPIVGNFLGLISKGIDGYDTEMMQKYNRTCGYFEGNTPIILTSDPKFIKDVMIKDAGSFVNRRIFEGLMTIDPADKFLTVLKDDEWKNVRSILTTSFTSGKLKELSRLIRTCTKNAVAFADRTAMKDDPFDVKTLFGSFTLDVISSCLFGFEVNSLQNPDNEFIKHLRVLFSNSLSSKFALLFLFPTLSKFLAERNMVEFFPSDSFNFLKNVSEEIIGRRRSKLETRTDFIQNMVEHEEMVKNEAKAQEAAAAKNDETGVKWKSMKKTLTDREILAQAILFLAAGYETTASNLTLVAYNLANHPEYQDKLCEEIDEVLQRYKGEISYDSIAEMKYMQQVINETLRLYPPGLRADRVCNEDYEYNGMKIPKGTIWTACIWAMHRDPEFYPEPEKFMPERFSEEARKGLDNETFLPFGAGQRICIGMRLAMIETKMILAELLSKFKFYTCDKTPKKITIDKSGIARPIQPIILKIKARSQIMSP